VGGAALAIDFARSYLVFRSTRVNHTPRLQLDAACTLSGLSGPDGAPRRFVLTCPCIGEHMYLPAGLIQQPPYEFLMVAEHRREYAILRRHATVPAAGTLPEAHRLGEAMSTRSGVPAPVVALDVSLATHAQVRPATSHADLRAALDAGWPVLGRTTYLAEDGQTTVALEYPVKVLNVAVDRPLWQVDTGPVLVPDLSPSGPGDPGPLAGRFNLAFLVYNTWDRAEIALRRPTVLVAGEGVQVATEHYSEVRALPARNELFCAPGQDR
jgi:hypothetical protein